MRKNDCESERKQCCWLLFVVFVWAVCLGESFLGGRGRGRGATKRGTIKRDTEEFKMPAPRP